MPPSMPSFGPQGAMVPYQGPHAFGPSFGSASSGPSFGPSFGPPAAGPAPPPGMPPVLSQEPPGMVNQYGRYQSIYGMPPVWGPELVPPYGANMEGSGDHEPFPPVQFTQNPNAQIPRDWMWYRKTKTPIDWTSDWEPTIYLDTLTLQPTTRSQMLLKATDEMLGALDVGMYEARQRVEQQMQDGPFSEMSKGLDIMEHDFSEAVVGEGNAETDMMHRRRKPAMDMGHYTQHGRLFMRLESQNKREKRTNHFAGVAPTSVDTYQGCLWKAHNPLIRDNNAILFG